MKTIIYLIISLLLFSQTLFAQHPWQGEGTEQEPFKIYTIEDLENITNYQMDENYCRWENGTHKSYTNRHFRLMNNITDPLTATLCYSFDGYFHGNEKFITLDFTVTLPAIEAFNAYLIGWLYGTVDSLTLEGNIVDNVQAGGLFFYNEGILSNIISNLNYDTNINNTDYNLSYCFFLQYNFSIVKNCINNTNFDFHCEILSFYMFFYGNSGLIEGCINNGNINTSSNFIVLSGFCGGNSNGNIYDRNAIIRNCINNGNITIEGVPDYVEVAPFSTHNSRYGIIENCLYTGYASGKKTEAIGTFATNISEGGRISNCLNIGTIDGENVAGGIVSYMDIYH